MADLLCKDSIAVGVGAKCIEANELVLKAGEEGPELRVKKDGRIFFNGILLVEDKDIAACMYETFMCLLKSMTRN